MDAKQRQELVVANHNLALKVACEFLRKVPRSIERDELSQVASLGLVEAAARFEEGKGAKFSVFAYMNIVGRIKDFLQQNTWLRKKRGNGRQPERALLQDHEPLAPEGTCVGSVLDVRRVVGLLRWREIELIQLRFVEQKEWDEVAKVMGLHPGTVYNIRKDLWPRLQDILKAYGPEND